MLRIRRAIVSVSNKDGIVEFAKELERLGVEIISTGGTLALLQKNKVKAVSISSFTQFPEILEGRLKTLHPKIHGGLLYRREKKSHVAEAKKHGIRPIDMVVVNLYPFEETTKGKKITLSAAIEEIDIGGPTMLRSAAKNFSSVAVVSDPADYAGLLDELKKSKGKISDATRYRLACKVFQLTSRYDTVISNYLSAKLDQPSLPDTLQMGFRKTAPLRYGENPHQSAALYDEVGQEPALVYRQLHGKELSYNNLIDLESAWDVVQEFEQPAASVIKHNTPCGIAAAKNLSEAAEGAIDSDPVSAFGGIVGLNRGCDWRTAEVILQKLNFLEVIAAPSFEKRALVLLTARKNLRLLEVEARRSSPLSLRFTKLGLLAQQADSPLKGQWADFVKKIKCVTEAEPSTQDLEELFFAWRCAKVVKSNGIVLTRGGKTVGIGAGQVSRVDAVQMACAKAAEKAQGSYLASDGFFPMPDNIEIAAKHGVRAIVQPGGSIKDQDVVDAANRHGVIMIVTGSRHFRH